jgi:hypothetical protein
LRNASDEPIKADVSREGFDWAGGSTDDDGATQKPGRLRKRREEPAPKMDTKRKTP